MIKTPRRIARVAIFSALIYVFSYATLYLPNIKVIFFVIFSAGFLWGSISGALVGALGMGMWSMFNPYGPAAFPIFLAQVAGAAACGPVGSLLSKCHWHAMHRNMLVIALAGCSIICTILFFLPVNVVDAWVYQPFWPRFISALPWTLISLVSNIFIFPLLFPVTRFLYEREYKVI
jgi:uncharacterized membrane protein